MNIGGGALVSRSRVAGRRRRRSTRSRRRAGKSVSGENPGRNPLSASLGTLEPKMRRAEGFGNAERAEMAQVERRKRGPRSRRVAGREEADSAERQAGLPPFAGNPAVARVAPPDAGGFVPCGAAVGNLRCVEGQGGFRPPLLAGVADVSRLRGALTRTRMQAACPGSRLTPGTRPASPSRPSVLRYRPPRVDHS